MKDKKGFTLIELIATIVILGIVASLGAISITSVITNSKEKNRTLLLENIKTAAENFYNDCKYMDPNKIVIDDLSTTADGNLCQFQRQSLPLVQLSTLVNKGLLSSNKTRDNTGTGKLFDPKTNEDISDCTINILYQDGKIVISTSDSRTKCPSSSDFS